MAACRVIAQVYNPDTSPWRQGAVLRYVLQRGSYTLSGNYPRGDFAAKIGTDGIAIVNLWVNEEGIEPTNWQVFFPNGESDIFSIPPGTTDATLEYLRLLSSTPNPGPPSLGAAINAAIAAHNADPNAHPGLGGGQAMPLRRVSASGDLLASDRVLVESITPIDLLLPNTSVTDGVIAISSIGALFRITQRSGQQIRFGTDNSSLGTGGYLEALEPSASIELLQTGLTEWLVISSIGNFEIN